MECPKCGTAMVYKEGTSHKGNAYKMNKCPSCNEVKFINTPKPAAQPQASAAPASNGLDMKLALLGYAKDLVVGEMRGGTVVVNPFKSTVDGFKTLLRAYANPFGKDEQTPETEKPATTEPEVGF